MPYHFQASVHPLTVHEHATLRKVVPVNLKEYALYPFVFETVPRTGPVFVNKISSELEALLFILEDTFESNGNNAWDVPTICEWLALSGCDSFAYPWGDTPPTATQANIHFPPRPPKLRPVGTCPLGVSRFAFMTALAMSTR